MLTMQQGSSLNGGLVTYQNQAEAELRGLVSCKDEPIRIGIDHTTHLKGVNPHRDSVRIESKKAYKHGLFIARFTHLPENKCGLWPAL